MTFFNVQILSLKFKSSAVAYLVKTEALAQTVNALDAKMAKLVACAKQVPNQYQIILAKLGLINYAILLF